MDLDGGHSTRVNTPFTVPPFPRQVDDFVLDPTGRHALYAANHEGFFRYDLYSAPSDGSRTAVRLNVDDAFDFPQIGPSFRSTADGETVVFLARVGGRNNVFSCPIRGGRPPLRLNLELGAGQEINRHTLSPDGTTLVYRADHEANGRYELYSVPVDGRRPPIRISGPAVPGGRVFDYAFTEDSSRVVYIATQDTPGVMELFSTEAKPERPPEQPRGVGRR